MSTNELLTLGLDVPDISALLHDAAPASRQAPDRRVPASARCYDDPSGMRLYRVGGGSFHAAPGSSDADPPQDVTVTLARVHGRLAHAEFLDADGTPLARVLVDCDDMWTVPEVSWCGRRIDLSGAVTCENATVSAVSVDVTVHDHTEDGGDGHRTHIAPSVLSDSLPQLIAGGDPAGLNADAVIVGRVVDVDLVTNRLTGRQWYRAVVDVSLPVPLALPADLPQPPKVGSWVSGTVRLCVSTGVWDRRGTPVSGLDLPDWWHRDIATFADDRVVGRASGLLGAVADLQVDGREVTATVFGTQAYAVTVDLDRPLSGSRCTCPHFSGGHYCKHIVATSMVLGPRGAQDGTEEHDVGPSTLSRFLGGASRDELADIVRRFLVSDADGDDSDDVRRQVRREIAAHSGRPGDLERVLVDEVGEVLSCLAEEEAALRGGGRLCEVLGNAVDAVTSDAVTERAGAGGVQARRLLDGLRAWSRAHGRGARVVSARPDRASSGGFRGKHGQ